MHSVIYIIGKPYPHAESVEALRKLGYSLGIFLDRNASLRHPEHYQNVIPLDFSGTVPLSEQLKAHTDITIDGLYCLYENYILAKAEIARFFDLPALSIDAARKSTDKNLMRAAFTAADPRITPRYSVVTSEAEALSFASTATYPLMLKPTNLVKSLLVTRCDNEAELVANFRYAAQSIAGLYEKYHIYGREPQLILEEFITGQLCSVAAIVDQAGKPHFCDGIVGLTTANDIGIQDSYLYERLLPATYEKSLEQQIFSVAEAGIAALGLQSSPAHVELIHNDNKVKIVEIGARTGGYRTDMYLDSYGINLLEQELRVAIGQLPDLTGTWNGYSSVTELFPETEGVFGGITGDYDRANFTYFNIKAKPGQPVGPAKQGYKAAAIIRAVSADKSELDSARQTIAQLKVRVD